MKSAEIFFASVYHKKLQINESVITKWLQENYFLNREEKCGRDLNHPPPPPISVNLNKNILESVWPVFLGNDPFRLRNKSDNNLY
jgi:hypothetical protein